MNIILITVYILMYLCIVFYSSSSGGFDTSGGFGGSGFGSSSSGRYLSFVNQWNFHKVGIKSV